MFCPKCGSILRPKKEGSKRVMGCSCGYTDKSAESAVLKERVAAAKEIAVVEKEDDRSLPETDAECPQCKNPKAFYWLAQTRAGDEPETKFLKCTKCSHTWRDYS